MMPSVAMIIQCWHKIEKISTWSTGGIIESIVHPMTCHMGRGGVEVQIYSFCDFSHRWWCVVELIMTGENCGTGGGGELPLFFPQIPKGS